MSFVTLIAFLNPIFYGISNVVDSHLSNNLFKRNSTVVFYCSITNILSIPVLFLFGTPQPLTLAILPFILAVGILEFLYIIPYFLALRSIDTSIIAALFTLGKITIPFLAYFIVDEKLQIIQYIGFAIIIFFTIILSINNFKTVKINKAFYLMLLSSFFLAVQVVMYKAVLEEFTWVSTAFYTCIFSFSCALSMFFIKPIRTDIISSFGTYRKNIKLLISNEAAAQTAYLGTIFSLSYFPVLAVEAIGATQPLFVLLYGVILYKLFGDKFKEDINRRQIIKKIIDRKSVV